MRLLVDIDDKDRASLVEAQEHEGHVVVFTGGKLIHGQVIGQAVPHSVAGRGDHYKAMYDVTLLGALE